MLFPSRYQVFTKLNETQSDQDLGLAEDMLLRGVVWALVGAIFGMLFVLFVEVLSGRVMAPFDILLATVGGAAVTSLFYGSMRLTVLVANFTFMAMLVYTWLGPPTLSLMTLVFVGAGVGVTVGAAYGLNDKASRVFCAEAKIIAGAVAGGVAGALALVVWQLFPGLSYPTLAMLVAPVGILAYIMLARWFIARCHHLLPAVVDGIVVGLGVGAVTGLMFVVMAGALDGSLIGAEALRAYVGRVEANWGETILRCALCSIPFGFARAIIRAPWYNL